MKETEESSSKGVIIQCSDFCMKQLDEQSIHFDLYLLYVINKGKPNERKELQIAGYGMTLEACIRKIIAYRTRKRGAWFRGAGNEGLRQYLEIYTEELNKLLELFSFADKKVEIINKFKQITLTEPKQVAE